MKCSSIGVQLRQPCSNQINWYGHILFWRMIIVLTARIQPGSPASINANHVMSSDVRTIISYVSFQWYDWWNSSTHLYVHSEYLPTTKGVSLLLESLCHRTSIKSHPEEPFKKKSKYRSGSHLLASRNLIKVSTYSFNVSTDSLSVAAPKSTTNWPMGNFICQPHVSTFHWLYC